MIAHVTNSRVITSATLISLCFVSLFVSSVQAATKSYEIYSIKKAWVDSTYLYVLYKKSRQTAHYSITDKEGTIVKEESDLSLAKIPREKLKEGETYSLDEDNLPSSSTIYQDTDFSLVEGNDGVTLSSHQTTSTIDKCSKPTWLSGAIRVRDRLFFCGVLFDKFGKSTVEVPGIVIQAIENKLRTVGGDRDSALLLPSRLISVVSKGELLVTRHAIQSSSDMTIAIWPLEKDSEVKWVKVRLPDSAKGYYIQNESTAYSPTGFVLKPMMSDEQWSLFCDVSGCKRIELDRSYSYAIFDAETKKVILLLQKNMTSPMIAVHTMGIP